MSNSNKKHKVVIATKGMSKNLGKQFRNWLIFNGHTSFFVSDENLVNDVNTEEDEMAKEIFTNLLTDYLKTPKLAALTIKEIKINLEKGLFIILFGEERQLQCNLIKENNVFIKKIITQNRHDLTNNKAHKWVYEEGLGDWKDIDNVLMQQTKELGIECLPCDFKLIEIERSNSKILYKMLRNDGQERYFKIDERDDFFMISGPDNQEHDVHEMFDRECDESLEKVRGYTDGIYDPWPGLEREN